MSANAIEIIDTVTRAGVELYLVEGKLKARAMKGQLDSQLTNLIRDNKSLLIEFLTSNNNEKRAGILKQSLDCFSLSFAQQRIWFFDQFDGESSQYNMSSAYLVDGLFDLKLAEQAFTAIIGRHEILRTVYIKEAGGAIQQVRKEFDFKINHQDLSFLSEEEKTQQVNQAIQNDSNQSFDLENDLMIRISYFKLAESNGALLFNMHHIASDGWSLGILVREFSTIYQALQSHSDYRLEELPIQYIDYTVWESERLKSEQLAIQLNYWRKQLAELPAAHSLPAKAIKTASEITAGQSITLEISASQHQALKALARKNQTTLFMLLHSAFCCLLARYSGADDLVLGTPVANRKASEIENLIGFFVNTLILRVKYDGQLSFSDFLKEVKRVNLEAQENQEIPLEKLVEELDVARDASRNSLFQIMFSMNTNDMRSVSMPDLNFMPLPSVRHKAKFELELNAIESVHGLTCVFDYNQDVFEKSLIENMTRSFDSLIEAILDDQEQPVNQLKLLADRELQPLRNPSLNREQNQLNQQNIGQIFEAQVQSTPHNEAVVLDNDSLTYQALNSSANQLANLLVSKGVLPGALVGISLNKSFELIIGTLAILKTGAAYVPIDPEYPRPRIEYMVKDSGIQLILCDSANQHLFGDLDGTQLLALDASTTKAEQKLQATGNLASELINGPTSLAYIIYTSGSTGQPKGVMINHRNWMSYRQAANRLYQLTGTERVLQFSSVSFDIFIEELSVSLLSGGCLVLNKGNLSLSSEEFWQFVKANNISFASLPTAYWQQLAVDKTLSQHTEDSPLRILVAGGEAMTHISAQIWQQTANENITLFNTYGPTEATVIATAYKISRGQSVENPVPIGRPLADYELYVLDQYLQYVPPGSVGELYIGGFAVSEGYFKRENLTQNAFIENPHAQNPGDRLYKTGDLVKLNDKDELVFIKRIDEQVKIRGFRVELNEIENQLNKLHYLSSSKVLVKAIENHKKLVAYIVIKEQAKSADSMESAPSDESIANQVKQDLSARLPSYMVPTAFTLVKDWPLTNNGKLDSKALLSLAEVTPSTVTAVATSPVEKQLVKIWSQILGIPSEHIGVDSNFFELGGDSILSIQVASKAAESGYKMTVKQIFEFKNIRTLAENITLKTTTQTVYQPAKGQQQLLPIQRAFFEESQELNYYNQAVLLQTPSDINAADVKTFIEALYRQHDVLRLAFTANKQSGQWQASYLPVSDTLPESIFEHLSIDDDNFNSIPTLTEKQQRSFDLNAGHLIRAIYLTNNNGESRLLLILHHLISDGVSWRILIDDLQQLTRQHRAGELPKITAQSMTYQHWADFLYRQSASIETKMEVEYWRRVCRIEDNEFVLDKPIPDEAAYKTVNFELDNTLTQQLLKSANKRFNTHINELLMAGLLLGINRWGGFQSVRIDLEGHGREELNETIDLTRTVGWFTTLHPLKLASASSDLASIIATVKETYRAIPQQGIGFGLLKYLAKEPSLGEIANSPVLFNYLGQFGGSSQQEQDFHLASEPIGNTVGEGYRPGHALNFNAIVHSQKLKVSLNYCVDLFSESKMHKLTASVESALTEIINLCVSSQESIWTKSDFPLSTIQQQELSELQQKYPLRQLYPATAMQQGMIFHSELESGAYNCQMLFTLGGAIDLDRLHQAWTEVANRWDALKTCFYATEKGDIEQLVVSSVDLAWQQTDLTSLDETRQAQVIDEAIKHDKNTGFDIAKVPLLRISTWRIADNQVKLLLTNHHAILDGWSMPLLLSDVSACYEALRDQQARPENLFGGLTDYMQWLNRQDKLKARNFWQQELSGIQSGTLSRKPSIAEDSLNRDNHTIIKTLEFTLEESDQFRSFAKRSQVTVNSLLQAGWGYLLSRYTGQGKAVFCTAISGRPPEVAGIEKKVGLFINTVPVSVDLLQDESLAELLARIHATQVERESFGYLSLNEILSAANLTDREFLSESLLVFENYPIKKGSQSASDDAIQLVDVEVNEETNFNLSIAALMGEKLKLKFKAKADSFDPVYLSQIMSHLKNILLDLTREQTQRISDLPMLTSNEVDYLVNGLNNTQVEAFHFDPLTSLFESQVKHNAASTAVVYKNTQITFQELNVLANQLASLLLENGSKPGDYIGISSHRSVDMIVAILGVIKAGCAYVPIEPDLPDARIEFILKDASIKTLICQQSVASTFTGYQEVDVIEIDKPATQQILQYYSKSDLTNVKIGPETIAYIIYTSGTTGTPKGVKIAHGNLLAFLKSFDRQLDELGVSQDSPWLWSASFAFDASVKGILSLIRGRLVVMTTVDDNKDLTRIADLLSRYKVEVFNASPLMIEALIEQLNQTGFGKLSFITGGEALSNKVFDKIIAYCSHYGGRAINAYGPTETTINSTYSMLAPGNNSIGRPIVNTQLFILDAYARLMPFGAIGELYIGGDGVSQGYINNAALNKLKFIPNPYKQRCHVRGSDTLYKTGDLVRYKANGEIEYIGRIDHQVKIRGYRIELEEVQSALLQHPLINQAVVTVIEKEQGSKMLVAYLVAKSEEQRLAVIQTIKDFVAKQLPSYMIPGLFISLDKIPLTSNGKIDYQALPETNDLVGATTYRPPATTDQQCLVDAIAQVLELDKGNISLNTNFFELGGDSISLLKVVSLLRKNGISIKAKAFYEKETLLELFEVANLSDKSNETGANLIVKLNDTQGALPVFFIHPLSGGVECYKALAKNLTGCGPIYGIQAPYIDDQCFQFDRLEQLAQLYAKAIVDTTEPPYIIGGWSVGGTIAQKIIEIFNKQNIAVEHFVAFDSYMLNTDGFELAKPDAIKRILNIMLTNNGLDETVLNSESFANLNMDRDEALVSKFLLEHELVSKELLDKTILYIRFWANFFACKRQLTHINTTSDAILFTASDSDIDDISCGWNQAVNQPYQLIEVDSDHLTILEERGASPIKEVLNQLWNKK